MPAVAGEWRYVTSSSIGAMNGRKGTFTVVPAGKDNHGMVLVDGEHNFKYADGIPLLSDGYDSLCMDTYEGNDSGGYFVNRLVKPILIR